jgi:hypothetical protein
MKANFPCVWEYILSLLVTSVTCIWFKVVRSSLVGSYNGLPWSQARRSADTPDNEVEPTSEAHGFDSVSPPSPYIGSVVTLTDTGMGSDSDSRSNFRSDTNFESRDLTTTTDIPSPRSLPVVVTTSNGQVLFSAEITLSSNRVTSTSPTSVKFSVDVVASRNLSSCESHFLAPLTKETISISDAAKESSSDSAQTIDAPTEAAEDLEPPSDESGSGAAPQSLTDWSTEDTDIGEPPLYMLAGTEVDDDDGWQVSGAHALSVCGSHAQLSPQSTVATVVPTTATALDLTLFRCTKPPRI